MPKKPIITLLVLLATSTIILAGLYFIAPMPNRENNGFKREIKNFIKENQFEAELGEGVTKISGIDSDNYYFTGLFPYWVLRTDKQLDPIDTMFFSINRSKRFLAPNTIVDSPYVYMYAGNLSTFIKGTFGIFEIDTLQIQSPVFMRSVQISPYSMIIRGFNESQVQQELRKIDCFTGKVVNRIKLDSNKNDLGVSTDGKLKFDHLTNTIVYFQQYQNSFYCLDTNLNLITQSKTIDTLSDVSITLENVKSNGEFKVMPTKSLNVTNIDGAVYNGKLYILSSLRGDNEQFKTFTRNYPIDVYNLSNGGYSHSFYIPKRPGKKIINIEVEKNRLVSLFEGGLVVIYEIPI